MLKPISFAQFFMSWAKTIYGPNDKKNSAVDGKSLKGSFDRASGKKA